jgi:hypothetical protein
MTKVDPLWDDKQEDRQLQPARRRQRQKAKAEAEAKAKAKAKAKYRDPSLRSG